MSDYRVLDLFAGLGGFSSAFEDLERWAVTTVDIDERFDPDIQADVFELRPSDFSGRSFDVVLVHPVGYNKGTHTVPSTARTYQTRRDGQ